MTKKLAVADITPYLKTFLTASGSELPCVKIIIIKIDRKKDFYISIYSTRHKLKLHEVVLKPGQFC